MSAGGSDGRPAGQGIVAVRAPQRANEVTHGPPLWRPEGSAGPSAADRLVGTR